MTARQARAVRGASAAAVTAVVAAAAHTLAGTGAPSPLLIAVSAVLAAPIAVALVGMRPSVLRISAAVLAAQVVFHVVFALFGSDSGIVYAPMDHAMMGHSAAMIATGQGSGHAMLPDPPMLAAHALAALATVFLLHRGEGLLRAIARGVRRLLPTSAVLAPSRAPRLVLASAARAAAPRATFASDLSLRGPPVLFG